MLLICKHLGEPLQTISLMYTISEVVLQGEHFRLNILSQKKKGNRQMKVMVSQSLSIPLFYP